MSTLAYHYTSGDCISSILEEGVIRLATEFIPAHVKAAVWLTTAETFEPTARKRRLNPYSGVETVETIEHMLAERIGVYRIAVEAARFPLTWRDYCIRRTEKKRMLRFLQEEAERQGSDVSLWRVSFEPIPERDWLKIQSFDGTRWATDWAAEPVAA
jgi:hypothetical protein